MKVDLNQEVNLEGGARAVFIASFATFIFTSLFAVSLANASIVKADATASVASANNGGKLAVVSPVDDEGRRGGAVNMPVPTTDDDVNEVVTPGQNTLPVEIKNGIAIISVNPLKINANNSAKVSWKSESVSSCIVKKDGVNFSTYTSTSASGISTGILAKDTKFTIECQTESGVISHSALISVTPVPVTTAVISASETEVSYGQSTFLAWKSENAKSCTIKKDGAVFSSKLNSVDTDKITTGVLTKNTKFSITCTGRGGSANAAVDIKVKELLIPTVSIEASNKTASSRQPINIKWSSTDSQKCALMQGTRSLSNKKFGEMSGIVLEESTVVWLTCSNAKGSSVDAVSIQVTKDMGDPVHPLAQ